MLVWFVAPQSDYYSNIKAHWSQITLTNTIIMQEVPNHDTNKWSEQVLLERWCQQTSSMKGYQKLTICKKYSICEAQQNKACLYLNCCKSFQKIIFLEVRKPEPQAPPPHPRPGANSREPLLLSIFSQLLHQRKFGEVQGYLTLLSTYHFHKKHLSALTISRVLPSQLFKDTIPAVNTLPGKAM